MSYYKISQIQRSFTCISQLPSFEGGKKDSSTKLHCPIEVRDSGNGYFTLEDQRGFFQINYNEDVYLDGVLVDKESVTVGKFEAHLDRYIGNRCNSFSTTESDKTSYFEHFNDSSLWLFSVQHITDYAGKDFGIELFDENGGVIDLNNVFMTDDKGIYRINLPNQSGKVKITVYGYEGENAPLPYIEISSINESQQVFANLLNNSFPFQIFEYKVEGAGSYTDLLNTTSQVNNGNNVHLCTLPSAPTVGQTLLFKYQAQGQSDVKEISFLVN